ncbi:MAG: glycosyltransferase [Christensenellaceae bacterium]|jgi:cellulose synthase/poly-beta-1,6-N-acetylglucosamine synthase-like glycosyltransferase|nr:glycosyltransferase [Christensenellaceae bacterium]
MELVDQIIKYTTLGVGILAGYQIVLLLIGLFFKARIWPETDVRSNFAVLIPARNEEKVIGNLIESIQKQNYPQAKITIFVIADNCQDKTAEITRKMGAVAYEHNDPTQQRRGYALDYGLQCIKTDYATEAQPNGILAFDGYFMFDADNLLDPNFVLEMNKAFQNKKYGYFMSYIHSKNIDTSFISSWSSKQAYVNNSATNRPTNIVRHSPRLRGPGGLVRAEYLSKGWLWPNITEDWDFSFHHISRGVRGAYVEAAQFYDEQANNLKILLRQRKRWEKGHIQVWLWYCPMLFWGMLWNRGLARRFSCYDQLICGFPTGLLSLFMGFLYPLATTIYNVVTGTSSWLTMATWVGTYFAIVYAQDFARSFVAIIRERKRIRCKTRKLFARMFFWPFIAIMLQYNTLVAYIIPIKWKVIPHTEDKKIETMNKQSLIFERTNKKVD